MIIMALAVLVLGATLTWNGTSAILEVRLGDSSRDRRYIVLCLGEALICWSAKGSDVKRAGASARTSEHDRASASHPPSPFYQIGSKMNHVEQNVTNGIVALLKKAVLFQDLSITAKIFSTRSSASLRANSASLSVMEPAVS